MSLQDPEFDKFKQAYKAGKFEQGLQSLKILLAEYPQSFALRWHLTAVLAKLERFTEARKTLNKVLELRCDFVPALIMQVQLDFHTNDDDAFEDDVLEDNPETKQQARFDAIEQRLYKILKIDPNSVDALQMLSGLLRGHEGDAHVTKADQLLERAIHLAPKRIDLLEDRGNSLLARAMDHDHAQHHSSINSNIATNASNIHYDQKILELALADFQQCYALSQQHRYGLRVGSILHDLARFDEALATYDEVLAHVPADDPYRPLIIERRARSENNGAGEREQIIN